MVKKFVACIYVLYYCMYGIQYSCTFFFYCITFHGLAVSTLIWVMISYNTLHHVH